MKSVATGKSVACYHCGDTCPDREISRDDRYFCCHGCLAVYEILRSNDLGAYYRLNDAPGKTPPADEPESKFAFLDEESVRRALLDFDDDDQAKITLRVESIHCSSCIWLLENLYRLHGGIRSSRVNFLRKEVTLLFSPSQISLRRLVELMTELGYEPSLSLEELTAPKSRLADRSLLTRIGVAGFAFANIMLLSFPDYLALDSIIPVEYRRFFGWVSFVLALPVLLYSAAVFFRSAGSGLKNRLVNMDLPVSIGIIALTLRSIWDVAIIGQNGYWDSLTGLVLFLLVGRWFQQKTYDSLRFDRDYRSYFPMAVLKLVEGRHHSTPLTSIGPGDRILVRNQELIPADSRLVSTSASIDYSFVTGEASPVTRQSGDKLYAGGRQIGQTIEVEITTEVSQSYLTRLWEDHLPSRIQRRSFVRLADRVAKHFTITVIGLALGAALIWWSTDPGRAIDAAIAVLIIACPCALALASPFAHGTALRILGRNGLHARQGETVEALAAVDTIVLDKTGTISHSDSGGLEYKGRALTDRDRALVKSATLHSTHAISRRINGWLGEIVERSVDSFEEFPGSGIKAELGGHSVLLGSGGWLESQGNLSFNDVETPEGTAGTWLAIDNNVVGMFQVKSRFRDGLKCVISKLGERFRILLLTGDGDRERPALTSFFGADADLRFRQSPHDKLNTVEKLSREGRQVLMVGDGLNDAGALRAADVGVAVSENNSAFSPACDAIMAGEKFHLLPQYLSLARWTMTVIVISFIISFAYNVVGLGFALTGNVSPLVAAILMPLSSITVVLTASCLVALRARRLGM